MRELTDIQTERSRQLADPSGWIWLYDVEVPTEPPTRFRLTSHNTPVEHGFDSNGDAFTYDPTPIVQGEITESGEGDLPKLQLQVANESQFLRRLFEDYDGLVGQPVTIRLVHKDELGDPTASLRFDGQIVSAKVTAERVAWEVSALSAQQAVFPARRYQRLHCRHRHGGPECGYDLTNATLAAAHPDCTKSLAACREHGTTELAVLGAAGVQHPQRFGGFPGIPRASSR